MNPDRPKARSRLAPTPSGRLHLGNARTFLATWLSIRAQEGELLMRIEDIDRQRCRPEFESEQLRDLEWLGLTWDGPIVRQSERLEAYCEALESLRSKDLVYPCVCTRKELSGLSAPHEGEERRYPKTCRNRFANLREAEASGAVAWRFRVEAGAIPFHDTLRGACWIDTDALVGDFVVFTKEAWPSYQLAVVVDDAAQGINEITRGADLHASSARQILLADALGLAHAERWAHLGLVLDDDGERMAKRHCSTALTALREGGLAPERVLGLLAHSLGIVATSAPISLAEALAHFAWRHLSAADVKLDLAAL